MIPILILQLLFLSLSKATDSLSVAADLKDSKLNENIGNETNSDLPCKKNWAPTWVESWDGHNQTLMQGYYNMTLRKVAVYFDSYNIYCKAGWIYKFTFRAWVYMTIRYGNFGPASTLNVVVHEHKYAGGRLVYSKDPKRTPKINVLDLGPLKPNSWVSNSTRNEDMDLIANKLAYFVEFGSSNRFGSPSSSIWKGFSSSDQESAWADIFTYDLYTNLNYTNHALRYKKKAMQESKDFPRRNTFWFKNWFLPIYENYGGIAVLQRYFQLLHNYLPKKFQSFNIGEFVHFWSAAAGNDLASLAVDAFGWNDTYKDFLELAKTVHPLLVPLYNVSYYKHYNRSSAPTRVAERSLNENTNKSDEHNFVIIGASAGAGILALLILFILSIVLFKRKISNLETEIRALTAEEVKEFFEGDKNREKHTEEDQMLIQYMPFIRDYEIPKHQMIFAYDKVIGSGQFGKVLHGFVRNIEQDELVPVAVKMVHKNVDVNYFKAFLSEVKIMAYLGKHEHIVDLLGTCTANIKEREIFIALELCLLGNLEEYLKTNRRRFQIDKNFVYSFECLVIEFQTENQRLKSCNKNREEDCSKITCLNLLEWSQSVSNAMVYLTQKKVIHGDLAARNVLLTANRTAKICDFGLSRQYLNYAHYVKKSKTSVPWRWLAIECMKELKFSTASDVWAFGVLMWEIFSLGETPYGCYTYDLHFVDRLISGERLLRPTYTNREIFELMQACWNSEPTNRPCFQIIYNTIQEFITRYSTNSSTDDRSRQTNSCSNIVGYFSNSLENLDRV